MDKLPKIYLRNSHVKQTQILGEELEKDTPIVEDRPAGRTLNVAKVENTETTKRPPSAYNVFMKTTVATLADTHKHLSAKARYTLALELWREHKNK
jgi:hypothetical protein